MKSFVHLCFLCMLLSGSSFAQTTDEKAQSAYLTATDAYEKGNYMEAVNYLKQARDLLGKTNTKIQYLLVKTLMDAKDYSAADAELKSYFEVTPEKARDARYEEMVKSVVFVEKMKKDEQEREAMRVKKKSEDSVAILQRERLTSFERMRKLRVDISENQRRASGKTVKGVISLLIGAGMTAAGLSMVATADESGDESQIAPSMITFGVGFTIFITPILSSFPKAKKLRRTNKFLKQELDRLESQGIKKQITFTPFYTPRQQAAGLVLRMQF
ncbi:tetratricopeptide repeat protein [Spirosoma soli]|uniref:Tetratricopeptide repeat protein n=1 Tax=Spirosoma soli TaxID=1770529 RepID=A0ABW5MBB8_9BACT